MNAINNDPGITVKNNIVGPSIATEWTPEMVFNTGYIQAYANNLGALSVEKCVFRTLYTSLAIDLIHVVTATLTIIVLRYMGVMVNPKILKPNS